MATVLASIGDAIKSALPKKEEYSFDKNQVMNIIDTAKAGVEAALVPTSLDFSKSEVTSPDFVSAHHTYMNGLGHHETHFFDSLKKALPLMKIDLEQIHEKFHDLFSDGTNPSEIQLEQLKTSHIAILGYIHSVETVSQWFCFMVSLITPTSERHPQYRVKFVQDNAKWVGEAVSFVLARKKGKTLVDDIKDLGHSARDVFLVSNGVTIDQFAHDTDYSKAVRGYMQEFSMWNILFWATDSYNSFFRWLYDDRKVMREWMLAKVAQLKLQQNGVPPTDSEYERLEGIIQKYSNIISQFDKKIADFENEA